MEAPPPKIVPDVSSRREGYWLTWVLGAIALVSGVDALGALAASAIPAIRATWPALVATASALLAVTLARSWTGPLVLAGAVVRAHRGGRDLELRAGQVLAGYRTGPRALVLRLKNRSFLHVSLAPETEVEIIDEILDQLQLNVGQRALRVPVRFNRIAVACVILGWLPVMGVTTALSATSAFASLFGGAAEIVGFFLPLTVMMFVALKLAVQELVIGNDAVRLERPFPLRPQVIPYGDIAYVATMGEPVLQGVLLQRKDGKEIKLRMEGQDPTRVLGIAQRITTMMQLADSGVADAGALASLLDRHGRPLAEWRQSLARARNAVGAFRDVTLPTDTLERVLASSTAPLDHRVAAALALRESPDPTATVAATARIRIAAEASADPRVRAALTAAAADELDDDELGHLLNAPRGTAKLG